MKTTRRTLLAAGAAAAAATALGVEATTSQAVELPPYEEGDYVIRIVCTEKLEDDIASIASRVDDIPLLPEPGELWAYDGPDPALRGLVITTGPIWEGTSAWWVSVTNEAIIGPETGGAAKELHGVKGEICYSTLVHLYRRIYPEELWVVPPIGRQRPEDW